MAKLFRPALAALLGMILAPVAAQAEDDPPAVTLRKYGDPAKAKLYEYDTSVPAAPALALVQNAPELSLTSAYGPDVAKEVVLAGEHPGASFAARPYWASGLGDAQTLNSYRADAWTTRVFARSIFSAAAAAREVENVDGLGAGLGLHTEFLDDADPRFNTAHLKCLSRAGAEFLTLRDAAELKVRTDPASVAEGKAVARTLAPSAKAEIDAAANLDRVAQVLMQQPDSLVLRGRFDGWISLQAEKALADTKGPAKDQLADCFKRGALAAENSLSFQAGVGTSWSSPTYNVSRLASDGASAWASFRIPLGGFGACKDPEVDAVSMDAKDDDTDLPKCLSPLGNLTAFGHLVTDDNVEVGEDKREARTLQAGVLLSHKGRNDRWSVAASAVWNERNYQQAGLPTDEFERYALSASAKLFLGVWIEATFGQTSGIDTAKDESFGLVRLTWK